MVARPVCVWLALALTSLLAVRVARAQDETGDDVRARQHYEAGEAYYQEGDYEGAVRELMRAYELSPRPALLYNLYLAEERRGQFEQAADHLESYLRDVPSAPNRELMMRRLANLRARAGGAGTTASEGPDTPAEAERLLSMEPEANPSSTPAPAATSLTTTAPVSGGPDSGLVGASAALLAVGGAGLVMLAVGGGLAASENDRLARSCGSAASGTCSDAQIGDLRTFNAVSDIGLGVGIVGVAAGAALVAVALASASPGEASTPRVTVRASPSEIGLEIAGTF